MSAPVYAHTFSLPRGYEIELSIDGNTGHLECRWSPDIPRGQRARKLLPFYRAARDTFLAGLDIPTLVVEL